MEAMLEEKVDTTMDVLHKEFPEEVGLIRKIIPLFEDHFRVNYINRDNGFIVNSYFVKISDGNIVEKFDN